MQRVVTREAVIDIGDNAHKLGKKPNLCNLDMSGLDLSGLNLRKAMFHGSICWETNFQNSDLYGANFRNSSCWNASFLGATVLQRT